MLRQNIGAGGFIRMLEITVKIIEHPLHNFSHDI